MIQRAKASPSQLKFIQVHIFINYYYLCKMRRTVGRKKCKSARLKDSNHMVQRALNVHLLQRDPIQRVHTERNSMNVAGCEAAAKIRHVL